MIDPHFANVLTHVICGATALACGAGALMSVKGGGPHRLAGRFFVAFGGVVLITALIGLTLFGGPAPLAAASLAAGYQYLSSLRALALAKKGPGWVDFGLALGGLAACGCFALAMGSGTRSWSPALGYSTLGVVSAVIAYDLSRHFWRAAWLRHARPLDHGVKMTNVYFGMLAAGVGNTLRDFQPWSQLLPTMLGIPVLAIVVASYLRRDRG